MRTDLNVGQRAVIFTLAVIGALGNGATDALVCLSAGRAVVLLVHNNYLRLFNCLARFNLACTHRIPARTKKIHMNFCFFVFDYFYDT